MYWGGLSLFQGSLVPEMSLMRCVLGGGGVHVNPLPTMLTSLAWEGLVCGLNIVTGG